MVITSIPFHHSIPVIYNRYDLILYRQRILFKLFSPPTFDHMVLCENIIKIKIIKLRYILELVCEVINTIVACGVSFMLCRWWYVQNYFWLCMHQDGVYSDINCGSLYQRLHKEFSIISVISLWLWTLMELQIINHQTFFWHIYLIINELPFHLRYC